MTDPEDTLPGVRLLTDSQMTVLAKRLAQEEGERLAAYLDTVGILTVGIGHNCKAKPVPGVDKAGDRITPEQEQELFAADVQEACKELDAYLPWWRELDEGRQCVMLDLCFNLGIKTLMAFHHTLAHVKAGIDDSAFYATAADDLQHSAWHAQVKGRAVFLEGAMRTGSYA